MYCIRETRTRGLRRKGRKGVYGNEVKGIISTRKGMTTEQQ